MRYVLLVLFIWFILVFSTACTPPPGFNTAAGNVVDGVSVALLSLMFITDIMLVIYVILVVLSKIEDYFYE